jgi:undecaprenyl-diphosphatase
LTTLQIVILAIVQGITEFLPISSSGHLVLVSFLFEWVDQGLAFDVAVHFGSLAAVCIFFRKDFASLLLGSAQILGGNIKMPESRMALAIALATIPTAIVGLLVISWIENNLRDPAIIVYTLSSYGIVMVLVDHFASRKRNISTIGLKDALIIGCAQVLSLVPGTSRSGVTITAARLLGFERQDAARFSFLLSAPIILLAAGYKFLQMLMSGVTVAWGQLGLGALIACIVAYFSIGFFMRIVTRVGLAPFAIYRLLLAAYILYVLI